MEFEWDELKNGLNKLNHNIDFADAIHVFLDPRRVFRKDTRKNYGEDRFQTIGITKFGILMVVYTLRDSAGVTRMISARKANKKEKSSYEQGYFQPYKES